MDQVQENPVIFHLSTMEQAILTASSRILKINLGVIQLLISPTKNLDIVIAELTKVSTHVPLWLASRFILIFFFNPCQFSHNFTDFYVEKQRTDCMPKKIMQIKNNEDLMFEAMSACSNDSICTKFLRHNYFQKFYKCMQHCNKFTGI